MADDLDARVTELRIDVGSLKNQIHDHENDIRAFGPLVTEQALIRQMAEREFESVRKSLDGAHDAIRALEQKLEREHDERVEGQIQRKRELEEATAARSAEIARIEAERERQNKELQARADQAKLENRKLLIGMISIFITSAAAVLAPILSGGGG